jgi:O-antigen/teichoic acid export membrane protein
MSLNDTFGPFQVFGRRLFGSMAVQGLALATGYLFHFMTVRLLGSSDFGRMSITLTLMAVLVTLAGIGMPVLLVRRVALGEGSPWRSEAAWAIRTTALAAAVLTIILFLVSYPLAHLAFHDEALLPWLLLGGLTLVPLTLLQVIAAVLQGLGRASQAIAFRTLYSGLGTILVFVAAFHFWPEPLLVPVAQLLVTLPLVLLGLSMVLGGENPPRLGRAEAGPLLHSGLNLVWASAALLLLGWADTLMLGMLKDAATAGIYALAFRLAILGNQVYLVAGNMIAPEIARAHAESDRPGLQRAVRRLGTTSFAGSLIFALIALPLAGPVLTWFGPDFAAGANALRIVVLGELAGMIFGTAYVVMEMTGQERRLRSNQTLFLGLNILVNLALIPKWGMEGAALATALTNIALRAALAWQLRRTTGVDAGLWTLFRSPPAA